MRTYGFDTIYYGFDTIYKCLTAVAISYLLFYVKLTA